MRISWDDISAGQYEVGVDRGVLYPQTGPGVPWNGLTSIKEDTAEADASVIYIDGQRKINQLNLGTFSATLEAFTYPDEFLPYDGYNKSFSGQRRSSFGLSYRTMVTEESYKLHLVYNCMVKPSNRDADTIDDSVDISEFSWDLTTVPVPLPYGRPTSHLYIPSTTEESGALNAIENILYGLTGADPRMPTIQEIFTIFEANAIFTVTDNGDGTVTFDGPDDWVYPDSNDPTLWNIVSPTLQPVDEDSFFITSY